jgi:hypothetical protein
MQRPVLCNTKKVVHMVQVVHAVFLPLLVHMAHAVLAIFSPRVVTLARVARVVIGYLNS